MSSTEGENKTKNQEHHQKETEQKQQQESTKTSSSENNNNDIEMTDSKKTDNDKVVSSSNSQNDAGSSGSFLPTLPMSIPQFSIIAVTAIASTFLLMQNTHTHPEFYWINPTNLSAGQVMAFLVGFGVLTTFAGVHALALKEYLALPAGTTKYDVLNDNHAHNHHGHHHHGHQILTPFQFAIRKVTTEQHYNVIYAATEFTLCLFLFFVCDRTNLLERTGKKYDRDLFWFLCLVFLLAGLGTLKKAARPKPPQPKPAPVSENSTETNNGGTSAAVSVPSAQQSVVPANNTNEEHQDPYYHVPHLQRDQTEEWKGWMQVMFLWYHYFNAKEIYNAIRLFIAAYVWMTGFGNFSYYYMRKDFSLLRFAHMQWRLNFLCFWVCLLMQNEYMLYYICMLHTTFTVFIYIGLGIKSEMNQTVIGCTIKFAAMTIVSLIIWDVKGVFNLVWGAFTPLVQLHNPYKPDQDLMYEWQFRSHLDHLVWIFGMICAFFHPNIESYLKKLDNMSLIPQLIIKSIVVGLSLAATYLYYINVFGLDKKAYNEMHPYTSWIPIAIYIILRNISQVARQYHIHLFEFLGKITLETYISQYHIWLATTGVNGSPKKLLALLPGKQYPLLNFVIFSALSLFVSFKLFHSTNTMKSYFLPSSLQPEALKKVLVSMTAVVSLLYVFAYVMVMLTGSVGSSTSTPLLTPPPPSPKN